MNTRYIQHNPYPVGGGYPQQQQQQQQQQQASNSPVPNIANHQKHQKDKTKKRDRDQEQGTTHLPNIWLQGQGVYRHDNSLSDMKKWRLTTLEAIIQLMRGANICTDTSLW